MVVAAGSCQSYAERRRTRFFRLSLFLLGIESLSWNAKSTTTGPITTTTNTQRTLLVVARLPVNTSSSNNNNNSESISSPAHQHATGPAFAGSWQDGCLEGANNLLRNQTDYWYDQNYPIFALATVAPPQSGYSASTYLNQTWMYHLSFIVTRGVNHRRINMVLKRVFFDRYTRWSCVDKNGRRVRADLVRPFATRGGRGLPLTVLCPMSMELDLIHVEVARKWRKEGGAITYPPLISYNVQSYAECALQRASAGGAPPPPSPPAILACAVIKGDVPRKMLLQWIEYHRMVGIQKFLVYVHEPYRSSDWPNLMYVEYVPFDVEGGRISRTDDSEFLFQLAQKNDCLHRARAMGAEWVTTHDVDEYLQTMADKQEMQLSSVLDQAFSTASTDKDGRGALLVQQTHFGRRVPQEEEEDDRNNNNNKTAPLLQHENNNYLDYYDNASLLMIDHVHRGSFSDVGGKLILRPESVRYIGVHKVLSGVSAETIPHSILRLNHYRRTHLLHQRDRDEDVNMQPRQLDSSLRDAYRNRLAQRLEELA